MMSLKKNFLYNIMYQILILIIPLITTPYIARVVGPKGIGIQSYTYSIASYFVLFAMLGVNNHGNRSIAMVRDNQERLSKTFFSIFSLKVITSLFMLILYIITIIFMSNEYKILLWIQMIYIISALLDINWFFFGMEQFKITVIRSTVIKIISVICIFLFIKDSDDLILYSLILAISNLIGQLLLWKYIKKYVKFVKINMQDIYEQIKPTIILFIPVLAISIYKVMDKIMLGSMNDVIQVGFFENSEKIINIPLSIIIALGTVMLPKISNLQIKGNNEQIKKYISLSMDYVMFMAFGVTFGLIGVSKDIIPIFLGEDFRQCIDIVLILSCTIIFIAWANVIRTQFLIPKKKDKIYIYSTILGAIVNLILNILLISKFQAIGAAIGTVFAEATVAIYQTIKVRKELDVNKYIRQTIFYIIPGIVMLILIRILGEFLSDSIISIIIKIITGGSVYCLISLLYMIYNKNEVVINILDKYIFNIKNKFTSDNYDKE